MSVPSLTDQLPILPGLTDLARVRLRGEWHERVVTSFNRVADLYPDLDDCGPDDLWPGDRSGRIIEALSVLARYVGERPSRLDRLVETLPERLNSRGYVGRVAPLDELHTDQLWGNWFQVLGLIAYHNLTGTSQALTLARAIADNLFLATLPYWEPYGYDFHWYPSRPHHWKIYVHPGAGLASGGGLVHLYWATGEVDYLRAARQVAEMILRYRWREGAHGHSALSMLINLADMYAVTGERRYVDEAIAGQAWVNDCATSLNGEPFNLFLPRDTYMEGCGVGDWLVLNLKLWRATGRVQYLDLAEDVLFNALFHVQRSSGSFGCDAELPDGIAAERSFFEADWCCSMRGTRALGEAMRYLYATHHGDVLVNFFAPSEATLYPRNPDGATIRVVQETDYPNGGRITLTLWPDQSRDFGLRLRLPSCAHLKSIEVNNRTVEGAIEDGYLVIRRCWSPGDCCQLQFRIGIRAYAPHGFPAQHSGSPSVPTVVKGVRLYHGPLLLGIDNLQNDPAAFNADGLLLVPRDSDDLVLPSPSVSHRPSRYAQPRAHYRAVRLLARGSGGFAPASLDEQGAIVHLSPLSEHAGDAGCGPGFQVRYSFDCGLFRDSAGQRALDVILASSLSDASEPVTIDGS